MLTRQSQYRFPYRLGAYRADVLSSAAIECLKSTDNCYTSGLSTHVVCAFDESLSPSPNPNSFCICLERLSPQLLEELSVREDDCWVGWLGLSLLALQSLPLTLVPDAI